MFSSGSADFLKPNLGPYLVNTKDTSRYQETVGDRVTSRRSKPVPLGSYVEAACFHLTALLCFPLCSALRPEVIRLPCNQSGATETSTGWLPISLAESLGKRFRGVKG